MSRQAPKKSIKLISHLRRDKDSEKFVVVGDKDDINCTSSSIEIIEGSFSQILPIGSKKKNFAPICSSTPRYEDITDIEQESESETEQILDNDAEDCNVTFNYEDDVLNEEKKTQVYLKQLNSFVSVTNEMVVSKAQKRNDLFKKLNKYKRKIAKLGNSIEHLDKLIYFGKRIPRLLELSEE